MAGAEDSPHYSLRIGSLTADDFFVSAFWGVETVSTLFSFRIDAADTDDTRFLDVADLLGKDATFSFIPPHGHERVVQGIIVAVDALGRREGRPRYHFELAPVLWRLGAGLRSRVFQARSAVDIVSAALDAAKVPMSKSLSGSYSPRELCLQFGESDLNFVWRLLESEGIHAFFQPGEEKTTLVLADVIGSAPDSGAVLPFRPPTDAVATEEHVALATHTTALRPQAATLRDFNFLQPGVNMEATRPDGGADGAEVYEYPGWYDAPAPGAQRAKRLLDELVGDTRMCSLRTDCARLAPGFSFKVAEHPMDELNGKFVALHVVHRGSDKIYHNEVLALPDGQAWRPPRVTPRPIARGIQTAMVIGPSGEEINTDDDGHARIKVRFHWERPEDKGDAGSCWLRVSQSWAGAGMGALFLPRLGHEVIVRFLEGNPDRPIVVGSVYNGVNAPPATLPDDKTQSMIRTSSSLGNGGFNELRFEDASGDEQIFLQAQKDESIVVENDKDQEVRGQETLTVQKDRSRTIDQNQDLLVGGNDITVVQKNQTLTVQQNRETTTAGQHEETVAGSQSITVGAVHVLAVAAVSAENVGAAKALTVGGALAVTVGEDLSIASGGRLARTIGGVHKSVMGESREMNVTGDYSAKAGGKLVLDIDGAFNVETDKDHNTEIGGDDAQHTDKILTIDAKALQAKADKLTLSVGGQLLVEMSKSGGAVKIYAATLTIDGPTTTKGSSIDKTASGSPPSSSASPPKPEELAARTPRPVPMSSIKVTGPGGEPVGGLRFEAHLPDGSVKRGRLGNDGGASVPSPDSGDVKFVLPDLDQG